MIRPSVAAPGVPMYRWYPSFVKALITRWHQRSLNVNSWNAFPSDRFPSVAVVGNAGYLRDIGQGDRIDNHDLVIRMNNFQIRGFEAQVGSRVDLFLTTFFTDIQYDRPELRAAKYLVASVPNNFRKHRRQHVHHRHAEQIVNGLQAMRRTDVYVPEWQLFRDWIQKLGGFPSTGLMAIVFALESLDCEQIYLTGFSFFQGAAHYFPDQPSSARNHNFLREQQCLQTLLAPHVASGKVTMDPVMRELLEFPTAVPPTDHGISWNKGADTLADGGCTLKIPCPERVSTRVSRDANALID